MKSIFFLSLCLVSISLPAQQMVCGTTASQSLLEQQELEAINEIIYKHFSQKRREVAKSDTIMTLPIVVHIIQQDEQESISDEQVMRGIQHLNDAFANRNSYDRGKGADTKIRFCLAQTDPDGLYTTGITRTISPLASIRFLKDDAQLKNLVRWNTREYINIWLVQDIFTLPCERGVTGYAKFPSSHGGNLDGIVCEAQDFGSSPSSSIVQIHEMGHYLGLLHTFKGLDCKNYICLRDGDQVCDTPPDRLDFRSERACDDPPNSCRTDTRDGFDQDVPDMISNFMDYEDTNCQHDFTEGQKERMRYSIERFRSSLLASPACNTPCSTPISALFEQSEERIAFNTPIQFRAVEDNAEIYEWRLNGVLVSSDRTFDYEFPEVRPYDLELTVKNDQYGDACATTYKKKIRAYCTANAIIEVDTLDILPGDTLLFKNLSTNAVSHNWLFEHEYENSDNNYLVAFPQTGEYAVTLVALANGCEDIQTVTIRVGTVQPDLEIEIVEESAICSRDSITFSFEVCNTGQAAVPAGMPISFYAENPSFQASEPLAYFVTPELIDYSCCEVFTLTTAATSGHIYGVVNDDFSETPFSYAEKTFRYKYYESNFSNNYGILNTTKINPLDYAYFDTTACFDGDSVWLQSAVEDVYYHWDTGDSTYFTTVANLGEHWVDLTYCGITRRHRYEVEQRDCSCQFDLPNVFTPNADGLNDTFGLYYDCEYDIDVYSMQIFNRLGQLVFETDDPEESWTAENMLSDMYIYIIYLEESYEGKKEQHELKGNVVLLR